MARKKKQPRHGPPRRGPVPPTGLPDFRAAEGVTHDLVRSPQGEPAGAGTPLDDAQALTYQAFRETDPVRRAQLAREALTISPDCADAYVLLAEHSRTQKQALHFYQQGVAAGQRALPPRTFHDDVGRFWGLLETRPYMRARLGLAHTLWAAGRRDEAVAHLRDLLRLNPNDNQGIRHTLAGFLLFLDRDDDLARLLEQYPHEATAAWAYTRALLAFRRQGDVIDARRLLKTARKANRHVPAFLLGEGNPPPQPPRHYSPGEVSEALVYLDQSLAGWKSTPGAVAWLRAHVKGRKRGADAPQPRGPLGFVKKWINERLPRTDDVWQADFRRLPNWMEIGGEPVRPWALLVTSRSDGLVLAHLLTEEAPSAGQLWDVLVQAMQHPVAGEAHRPAELHVRPDELWEALRGHVAEVGVGLVTADPLDHFDEVFADLCATVVGEARPGMLDVPGVTPAQAAGVYEAAAAFFREAPWKKVGYQAAVTVEGDLFPQPVYAVLMGQSGLTIGLALYDDLALLRRTWTADTDEGGATETVGTTVIFAEEWGVPVSDVEAARRFGWPVARLDAFPSVFRKERGGRLRMASAGELRQVEACLRAVAEFVPRHRQDDPAREEVTIPASWGSTRLVLSWVPEEEP